jgi:DNA primase
MDDKLTALQRHLEEKYEGHDFSWKESGSKRILGLCPEHGDRNPSFNIFQYNDKAYYKCFSCGFHGGLYDFIQEGITPEQKEKYALNKENQKRLWEAFDKMKDYLLTADTIEAVFARNYLTKKRYLDMSAVKKGNVGLISTNKEYEPSYERLKIDDLLSGGNKISNYHGWLVFAHTNVKGDICRLKFREPDSKNIRTANIKGYEDEPAAFGLKSIGGRDSGDYPVSPYIYITEGEFNYLQYINATDIGNIISAGGKDNISLKLINTLLNLDFIPVVALDQDDAGKKQLRKIYKQTPAGNRENIVYCEYGQTDEDGTIKKDFDDIFKNKSEIGVGEVLSGFKFKTLKDLNEIIEEEKFKKKERIEKFIEDHIANIGKGLKEIYLDKYKIIKENKNQNIIKPAIKLKKTIERKPLEVFGLPIELGSIGLIAGLTGTGKTEFTMEIGDIFAKSSENNICLLTYYEGSDSHIQERLIKKGIDNSNLFYVIKPDFRTIETFVENNQDKKILIFVDYLQKAARHLRTLDKKERKTENNGLSVYTDLIFENYDNLRNKFDNVCVFYLSSFNNAGIKELSKENKPNPVQIAVSIKESGDISYDIDYGFALFFADAKEMKENKWEPGRKNGETYRKYMLLYPFKDSRLEGALKYNIYVFDPETRRYHLVVNNKNQEEGEGEIKNGKRF